MTAFGKRGETERCVVCGDRWSANSDFPVCSLRCAGEAFARLVVGLTGQGYDWKRFLPEDQRPDLVPWDAWQAGTRVGGKGHWRKIKTDGET